MPCGLKLLFLFSLLAPSCVFADSETDARLLIGLKTQTIVQMTTTEMKEQGVAVSATGPSVSENEVYQELKKIADTEFKTPKNDELRKTFAGKIPSWLLKQVTGAYTEARLAARKDGVTAGIIYLVGGEAGDFVFPVFFIAAGQPALAAVSVIFPWGITLGIGYVALKKFLEKNKTIKLYGGKASYRFYQDLEKNALSALLLNSKKDAIIPFSEDGSEQFIIASDSFLKRAWKTVSFNKDSRIKLKNLKREARDAGLTKEQLKAINRHHSNRMVRAALLTEYLSTHLSTQKKLDLTKNYPESFTQSVIPVFYPELIQWAQDSVEARNCGRLLALIQKTPQGIPVPIMVQTWTEVMLPEIEDQFKGVHINGIYQMVKKSKELEIAGKIAPDQKWDSSWQELLDAAVARACKNQPHFAPSITTFVENKNQIPFYIE